MEAVCVFVDGFEVHGARAEGVEYLAKGGEGRKGHHSKGERIVERGRAVNWHVQCACVRAMDREAVAGGVDQPLRRGGTRAARRRCGRELSADRRRAVAAIDDPAIGGVELVRVPKLAPVAETVAAMPDAVDGNRHRVPAAAASTWCVTGTQ